jgi:hypothetical protein
VQIPTSSDKIKNRELRDRLMSAASRGKVTGQAGAHSFADRGDDLYQTPPEAVRALLKVEDFEQAIWEPACGPGSIVNVLRAAGHKVVASDFKDYGCPDSRGDIDFLKTHHAPYGVKSIITNPPYRYAAEFVRHAIDLVPHVAMLVRLAFIESKRRSDILDNGCLARVYPFADRLPMMHRSTWTGPRATSSMAFAWFVWDADHCGPTELRRISWRPAS